MTKYAKQILKIIDASQEHLTAEQIFLRLKSLFPKVVLATVYNNLNALYAEGLINKVSIEGQPDRYDKTTKHDHLVCKICGHLSDIVLTDLTDMLNQQLAEPMLSYDLKISTICPACKAKENPD